MYKGCLGGWLCSYGALAEQELVEVFLAQFLLLDAPYEFFPVGGMSLLEVALQLAALLVLGVASVDAALEQFLVLVTELVSVQFNFALEDLATFLAL